MLLVRCKVPRAAISPFTLLVPDALVPLCLCLASELRCSSGGVSPLMMLVPDALFPFDLCVASEMHCRSDQYPAAEGSTMRCYQIFCSGYSYPTPLRCLISGACISPPAGLLSNALVQFNLHPASEMHRFLGQHLTAEGSEMRCYQMLCSN